MRVTTQLKSAHSFSSFISVSVLAALLTTFFGPPAQSPKSAETNFSTHTFMPPIDITGNRYVCPEATETYTSVTNPGSTYNWFLSAGGTILSQSGGTATIQWGNLPGTGPLIVRLQETDIQGITTNDTLHVFIKNLQMVCNDTIHVSLDATGKGIINADQILEGTYITFQGFAVNIRDHFGRDLGNVVDCSHEGQYLIAKVTNGCDPNYCWSTIFVEDKIGPEMVCPTDTVVLTCKDDPADVPFPVAIDNCDPNPTVNLISEERDQNNQCLETILKRRFIASDNKGYYSDTCEQVIRILPPTLPKFPEDITWTCEQYQVFPNIINPTAVHQCIVDNAAVMDKTQLYCIYSDGNDVPDVDPFDMSVSYWTDNEDLDVTLDPLYDDNIDNPFTDPHPNRLEPGTMTPIFSTYGNPSTETDNFADQCNLTIGLCPYLDTVINTAHHIPDTIVFPIYRRPNSLVRGLEDADVLELTGSGVPDVFGTNCNYAITYNDQKLEACSGADTNMVFKILRTWTIFNWCTGETYSDIQFIKVVDRIAPIIERDTFSVNANVDAENIHDECRSTEFLLPPIIKDNCTAIAEVQIFTPAGEAVYIRGLDGRAGGYIPAPGLKVGTHTIKYVATDACGNRTEHFVDIKVVDKVVPIMICQEYTDVSLTIDGTARLAARAFDAATYDNCCLDSFFVKRMDEHDSLFRSHIDFDCADVNKDIMVVMRAYDCSGNYNQCMIEVSVSDKLRPQCNAPEDVWTTCDKVEHLDLRSIPVLQRYFGKAEGIDNCDSVRVEELTPTVSIDQCGVGNILRRFRVIDAQGLISVGTCQQRIMIMGNYDYKINFPPDWTGKCGDIENAPKTTIVKEGPCDQLAIHHEDLKFEISSDGACYKIIRTWWVMDWCVYDGFSDPIAVPNNPRGVMVTDSTYNAHGYYVYKQIIKVIDDKAPVLTYTGPKEFCGGYTTDCVGEVDILPNIQEECTTEIDVEWKLDLYNDGTNNANGVGRLKRNLPLGKHKVAFEVRDGCGNRAFLDIIFEVKDCKKPTPICINGLSVDLMQDGTVSLWAKDFETGSSFDQCTQYKDLKFRINRIVDLDGNYRITPADYVMTVPRYDTVMFRCRDFGIAYVQMWVGDAYGNWDFCVTFVDVQDNMNMCRTGSKMGGKIATEMGSGVQGVSVNLSGNQPMSATTLPDGSYEFPNVPVDYDYTVTPLKDNDAANGVSTFDLVLISKHILKVQPLNSPYKIIAADANKSGNVSTLDLVELRRVILRVQNNLRNNTSWRFVNRDYYFPDPKDPFKTPFPEVISVNNFSADELDANFIAIKVGDVNASAKTSSVTEVEERTFKGAVKIDVENREVKAGEEVSVIFTVEKPADLLGIQFTLDFDKDALELTDVVENQWFGKDNFGFTLLDDGAITASWDNASAKSISEGDLKFELIFRAKQNVPLNKVLAVSPRYTTAEAYRHDGEMLDVMLSFGAGNTADQLFDLYQNKPNPFSNTTEIGFHLPEAATAAVTIFDATGKEVFTAKKPCNKGYNAVEIQRSDLPRGGIFYYRLETPTHTATRKMLLIK